MAASAAPTTCTIYLHGRDATVQFASLSYAVERACRSWVQARARRGERWTGQQPLYGLPYAEAQVCALTNSQHDVTASVLDVGDEPYGRGACRELIAAGWVAAQATSARPASNTRPTAGAPKLVFAHWSGTEPSQIDYSADAGNIVTGLLWSTWTRTKAVGEGNSEIQSCIPNCAAGADKTLTTIITLLDPRAGHFTQMTETRDGLTGDYAYGSPFTWPPYAS